MKNYYSETNRQAWGKRLIAFILCLVLMLTVFAVFPETEAKAAAFSPRTTEPDASNKYYKVTSAGGLNECIKGSNQTKHSGSALPNCVGYAWGRAYEITGSKPRLSKNNANQWYKYTADGYARGKTPKLGAIACWNYSNGGHVAVVEKIEGNKITLSQSAWGGRYFYTQETTNVPSLYSDWAGYIYIGNFSADTTPPTVSNVKISQSNRGGYEVTCTVSDASGVAKVQFPTWTSKNNQKDIIWINGTVSGNTAKVWVNCRDRYGDKQDTYITHIYATDKAGNMSKANTSQVKSISYYHDTTPPVISNLKISNITSGGYTVTCTVTDNKGVDKVQFPSWTLNNGQDDLFASWQTNKAASGTKNGNTYTYRVNTKDHKNESGTYQTNVYAYDKNGNYSRHINVLYADVPKASAAAATIAVSGVTLNKNSATLNTGGQVALKATVAPVNATNKKVTWASSNTKVATVSGSGVIKAVGKGTATITAKSGNGKTAKCTIKVKQPVEKLAFKSPAYTLTKKGKTLDLAQRLTVSPSNASNKNVTWKSSNSKVVKVSQKGKVTAAGNSGKATITATAKDGSGKKIKCTIYIGKKVSDIKFNKNNASVKVGKTYTIKPKFSPQKPANTKITWKSSNSNIAAVDKNGVVSGKKAGKVTITATTQDGKKVATCRVTVKK